MSSPASSAPSPTTETPVALSDQQCDEVLLLAEHLVLALQTIPVGSRAGVATVEIHCDEAGRPVRITGHTGNGRR